MSITDTLSSEAEELRHRLEEQLPNVGFDRDNKGNRQYKNVSAYVLPLLGALNLQDWGYTLWRFSTTITINNETGPVYLIPICNISGEPQIIPGGPLTPGSKTYANHVELKPELDCLFIIPMKKNESAITN